jgi:hypothetical protein
VPSASRVRSLKPISYQPENAEISYSTSSRQLDIVNTPSNLDLMESLLTNLAIVVSREQAEK